MERKVIKFGIYRHFKGKYYIVMGVSKPLSELEISKKKKENEYISFKVKYTEPIICDPLYIPINIVLADEYTNMIHYDCFSNEELVIYKSLYDGTGAYARPLKIFLSEVEIDKHPDAPQTYRFEFKPLNVGVTF